MRRSTKLVSSYFPSTVTGKLISQSTGAYDLDCKIKSAGADSMVADQALPKIQSAINQLRPEDKLLIYCIRSSVSSDSFDHLESIIKQGVDWEYIVRKADFPHGIVPLLYCTLKALSFNGVPEEVKARIQARYRQLALENLYLTGELLKILKLFKGQNVTALPFKGPLLAATAYGDLALRQFCDLDILVQPHDVVRAIKLLSSFDYHLPDPLTDKEITALLPKKKDFKLLGKDKRVVLEIHWRLVGRHFPFSFDLKRMWDDLEVAKISGEEVLNFAPEESLLFLCVHGSKHMWERLIWVSDTSRLVESRPDIDFEHLLRIAETHGCLRMVKLGLLLAKTLANAQLPQGVLDAIMTDKNMEDLSIESLGRLVHGGREANSNSTLHRFHISVRERLHDKLLLALYHIRQYARGVMHSKLHDKGHAEPD